MPQIKILPENLIAKIAAGEVIERPVSVVKELVENSLDAGAKYIDVEIEKAGKRKIMITDDGSGMDKKDLEIAYKPHATSKIKNEKDLEKVISLGFRGEALSSLAAVSNLIIETKSKKDKIGQGINLRGD